MVVCTVSLRFLQDIRELKATKGSFERGEWSPARPGAYICPLTRRESGGRSRFVMLWSCGHMFSEEGLGEVGATACPTCETPIGADDVVVLHPTPEEENARLSRFPERLSAAPKCKRPRPAEDGETDNVARKRPAPAAAAPGHPSRTAQLHSEIQKRVDAASAGSEVLRSLFHDSRKGVKVSDREALYRGGGGTYIGRL